MLYIPGYVNWLNWRSLRRFGLYVLARRSCWFWCLADRFAFVILGVNVSVTQAQREVIGIYFKRVDFELCAEFLRRLPLYIKISEFLPLIVSQQAILPRLHLSKYSEACFAQQFTSAQCHISSSQFSPHHTTLPPSLLVVLDTHVDKITGACIVTPNVRTVGMGDDVLSPRPSVELLPSYIIPSGSR
jgi:hypothetical protein